MNDISELLLAAIQKQTNAEKAAWLENYVKHDIRSYGVGTPALRKLVQAWEKKQQLQQQSTTQQEAVLNAWMQHRYTEPQLAAILWVQLYGTAVEPQQQLQWVAHWLDQQWIRDWNVCDWLCVRVLKSLLEQHPDTTVPILQDWNTATYVWKARCSLVPFAVSKTLPSYQSWLAQGGAALIQREERFCKTAVGWALREYSKYDLDWVLAFLERHQAHTTKEVVRNATKYQKKGSA